MLYNQSKALIKYNQAIIDWDSYEGYLPVAKKHFEVFLLLLPCLKNIIKLWNKIMIHFNVPRQYFHSIMKISWSPNTFLSHQQAIKFIF